MVQKKTEAPAQNASLESQLPEGFKVARQVSYIVPKNTKPGDVLIKGGTWIRYHDGGPSKFDPTKRNMSYHFELPTGEVIGIPECGHLRKLMTDNMVLGQTCFIAINGKKTYFDKRKNKDTEYWDYTVAPGPKLAGAMQAPTSITAFAAPFAGATQAPGLDLDISL